MGWGVTPPTEKIQQGGSTPCPPTPLLQRGGIPAKKSPGFSDENLVECPYRTIPGVCGPGSKTGERVPPTTPIGDGGVTPSGKIAGGGSTPCPPFIPPASAASLPVLAWASLRACHPVQSRPVLPCHSLQIQQRQGTGYPPRSSPPPVPACA